MKSQLIFQLILIGTFLSPGQTCSREKKGEVRSSFDDPEPHTGGPVTSSIGTNSPEHDTGEPDDPGSGDGTLGITPERPNDEFSGNN